MVNFAGGAHFAGVQYPPTLEWMFADHIRYPIRPRAGCGARLEAVRRDDLRRPVDPRRRLYVLRRLIMIPPF